MISIDEDFDLSEMDEPDIDTLNIELPEEAARELAVGVIEQAVQDYLNTNNTNTLNDLINFFQGPGYAFWAEVAGIDEIEPDAVIEALEAQKTERIQQRIKKGKIVMFFYLKENKRIICINHITSMTPSMTNDEGEALRPCIHLTQGKLYVSESDYNDLADFLVRKKFMDKPA